MQNAEQNTINAISVIAEILSVAVSTPSIETVENTINVSLPINAETLAQTSTPSVSTEVLNVLSNENVNLNELFTTNVSFANGRLSVSLTPIATAWSNETFATAIATALATTTATETTEA